ncbi:MAG: hypothetical protein IT385_00655 [Deltaproteobacteria bacterium]|nr:hypothetical protein [Deltaproteobacteria bacterium]
MCSSALTMNLDELTQTLPAMPEPERIRVVRALRKRDMARLWEQCAGRETSAEDFVPASVPVGVEVIHWGKNSLPVFSDFQKRFTRAVGRDGVVYGYNHTWYGNLAWTTLGPGYFTGHHDPALAAFGLDYYLVPPDDAALPASWPRRVPNERGLQRLIYARMVDYMRKVADGVTIGRAWRQGRITDNYFVLARAAVRS